MFVTKIFKSISNEEKDGAGLMNHLFSPNNPILKFEDNSIEFGLNIQKGYMQIFSGAIIAIRNPKAHENLTITKDAAYKRIIFASLLIDKIDEALVYSYIGE